MNKIIPVIALATLFGCTTKQASLDTIAPPAHVQNRALFKHLKNVWYVEVSQVTTNGPILIADFADEATVDEFRKIMRVTGPAANCFCRGDIFFTCYRTDGTMIELWYEPEKLSGAKGSRIYGVPTEQFNSMVKRICDKGVMKEYEGTILIR